MSKVTSLLSALAAYFTTSALAVAVVLGLCAKLATAPRPRVAGRHAKTPANIPARRACPSWCTTTHNTIDVEHQGRTVDLATLAGSGLVGGLLVQAPGQPARLLLAVVDTDAEELETEVEIAPEKAVQLAHGLLALVQSAN